MPINAILYEEYKNNHTIIELHSVGRSMEPQLNNLCTVYVMCCSASELSTGDIITFFGIMRLCVTGLFFEKVTIFLNAATTVPFGISSIKFRGNQLLEKLWPIK